MKSLDAAKRTVSFRGQLWEEGVEEMRDIRRDGLDLDPMMSKFLFVGQPTWGGHCPDEGMFWEPGWHRLGTFRRGGAEILSPIRTIPGRPVVTKLSWHRDCAEWDGVAGHLADAAYRQHVCLLAHQHRQKVYEAKLMRPLGFHPGQVVYLDGSGLMNPAALRSAVGREVTAKSVPQGYILTAFTGGKGVWQEAKDIVTKVAFGTNGHSDRYSKEYPFVLVGIANPNHQSPASRPRLEAGIQRLIGGLGDLPIKYHLYTAPCGV